MKMIYRIVFFAVIVVGIGSCSVGSHHRMLEVDGVKVKSNIHNVDGVKIRIQQESRWYKLYIENNAGEPVEIVWEDMWINTGDIESKVIHEEINLYSDLSIVQDSKIMRGELFHCKIIPVESVSFNDGIAEINEMKNYADSNHNLLLVLQQGKEKKTLNFTFGYATSKERIAKKGRVTSAPRGFIGLIILGVIAGILIA